MPVTRKRKQDNHTQSQSSQPAIIHVEFSAITKYQASKNYFNDAIKVSSFEMPFFKVKFKKVL